MYACEHVHMCSWSTRKVLCTCRVGSESISARVLNCWERGKCHGLVTTSSGITEYPWELGARGYGQGASRNPSLAPVLSMWRACSSTRPVCLFLTSLPGKRRALLSRWRLWRWSGGDLASLNHFLAASWQSSIPG